MKFFIVAGLGFGDEGKGTVVDWLVRKYNVKTVIRYNGGPQAAHNVAEPSGRWHCFSQFGSGTLTRCTKTFLSRFMLIDPLALKAENAVLKSKGIKDAVERLTIDSRCLIITPFHKNVNQMQEIARGDVRHGSCGRGVGQTISDGAALGKMMLFAGDLFNKQAVLEKLLFLWRLKVDLAEQIVAENYGKPGLEERLIKIKCYPVNELAKIYHEFTQSRNITIEKVALDKLAKAEGNMVFEGAQGVLLDSQYGFWPHVTQSDVTFKNAEKLLSKNVLQNQVVKMGILRAYSTRHGAGPFVSEEPELTKIIPDIHNSTNQWQGPFRLGWFDLVAVRYALGVLSEIDYFVLTNVDRLREIPKVKICTAYEYYGDSLEYLDQFFCWERQSGKSILRAIKVAKDSTVEQRARLAKLLKNCRPIYGWQAKVKTPKEIDDYLLYLEKNLDIKISTISIGPTWRDKIEI